MSFSAGADDLEVVTEWSQNSWKRADHSHQPAPADDTAQARDLRKRDNRRHERAPESSHFWEFKSHLYRHPETAFPQVTGLRDFVEMLEMA
jgi:hypothetical protein